ncbi:molybdate ABC transporter substrate-binding protein, partial [Saccharomonospora iraqiensis]|uniref:molybdate ABC transporter substrate-binding protein n=1 Tax=Saccharomonospora iraqiensis TaxID=52698 RepID=UPI003985CAB5
MRRAPGRDARATPVPRTLVAVLLAVSTLVVAGCGGVSARDRTLTVFAAASLTGVFGELERHFENRYPDLDVRLNVGGSARLARQIVEGAPADVFASADARTLRRVAAA